MFDKNKIDRYFNEDSDEKTHPEENPVPTGWNRHTRFVRIAKLLLPSAAAALIGLLLIFPSLKKDARDFKLDITRPKQGELEKLHVENTVLYVTDKDNKVNNFIAEHIDETEPGSKLIKLTKPEGLIPLNPTDWANIKAPIGYYDQNTNLMTLTDNVEIFYSEDTIVNTFEATFDFNNNRGFGSHPVNAEGYFGNLKAEGFEFNSNDDILIFTGHNDITIKEESLKGNNR